MACRLYELGQFDEVLERFKIFKPMDIKPKDNELAKVTEDMLTVGIQYIQQSITHNTVSKPKAVEMLREMRRIAREAPQTARIDTVERLLEKLPTVIQNIVGEPAKRQEDMIYYSLLLLSKSHPGRIFLADTPTGREVQVGNTDSKPGKQGSFREVLRWLAEMHFGWTFRVKMNGRQEFCCTHDKNISRMQGGKFRYPVY
ncbi:predicted protein [Uncinocarpus reesii 1704]|uniref:Uncharacterized protein n=1 Tax=Uncinocarpus reesii (strain UAMH 1704) TaxID=336963 RepID=C4K094_UNCRE|nr:uncharacterized protein UREG_07908 [Uncinocarpus reesii 1704]EEP83043.1 predicted protein [Uncinocarpus reesii 1704]